jgi:hypothetical protein
VAWRALFFKLKEYPVRDADTLARDPGAMAGRYCRSNAVPRGQRLPRLRNNNRRPIGMDAAQVVTQLASGAGRFDSRSSGPFFFSVDASVEARAPVFPSFDRSEILVAIQEASYRKLRLLSGLAASPELKKRALPTCLKKKHGLCQS